MLEGTLFTTLFDGLTGLIGTVWSSYNQRKIKALEIADRDKERAHEVDMVKAESEAMVAESEANMKEHKEPVSCSLFQSPPQRVPFRFFRLL